MVRLTLSYRTATDPIIGRGTATHTSIMHPCATPSIYLSPFGFEHYTWEPCLGMLKSSHNRSPFFGPISDVNVAESHSRRSHIHRRPPARQKRGVSLFFASAINFPKTRNSHTYRRRQRYWQRGTLQPICICICIPARSFHPCNHIHNLPQHVTRCTVFPSRYTTPLPLTHSNHHYAHLQDYPRTRTVVYPCT